MTESQIPRVDHLFLLIGGNPLPAAVAGCRLSREGGRITLVHSPANFSLEGAQRLQGWLCKKSTGARIDLKEVREADPSSIEMRIHEHLSTDSTASVGLNYTGGTKAMAVHAHRALERWAKQRGGRPSFTYLHAPSLRMIEDPAEPETGQRGREQYVGLSIELRLDDLMELHGWSLREDPRKEPILPRSARALAQVHYDDAAASGWERWTKGQLEPQARKVNDDWKNDELRQEPLSWPEADGGPLDEFARTFASETGSADVRQLDFAAPKDNGHFKKTKHIPEWLHGKWLEHHLLNELKGLAEPLRLQERVQNVVPREVEFDLDVIALRGYQLFAFSCCTDSSKTILKPKLFEVFVRARQLGGDEARAALVCCSDNPTRLEQEMRRELDPEGRIRVFGRSDLANLGAAVSDWIRSQRGQED